MTYLPQADSDYQIPPAADVTNVNHVWVDYQCRFNEWNQDFNFKKVQLWYLDVEDLEEEELQVTDVTGIDHED